MTIHNRDVRQDVRELGSVLGAVLTEQTSQRDFETVESCRTAAISYRTGNIDSREPLRVELDGLTPSQQRVVARSFTTYFELINLAEERARVRSIRASAEDGPLEDSIAAAIESLSDADPETVARVLDDVLIEPTFTAHPTEARRKTIKAKLREIAVALEELDEKLLTHDETDRIWRALRAEVTGLWQTLQVRNRPPTVEDEARNVQWYLERTLFDVVGDVYDELDAGFESIDVPPLVSFRSWAGSDRDGNPYVTPDVTAATLDRQRRIVLERYTEELDRLVGVLSQDRNRLSLGSAFSASLEADRRRFPDRAAQIDDRYPDEPYRRKLSFVRTRLSHTADDRHGGYADPDELRADLELIAESLRENGAETVARVHVDPLVRKVETFGFALASLDLRDHRKRHTNAIADVLDRSGIEYRALDETERVDVLTDAIQRDEPVIDVADTDGLSDESTQVLALFRRLADWHDEYGVDAIDTYCISMTEEPSHVLEVLFLADQAGIISLPDRCDLDIVPLLETEYALSGARRIMETLFENDVYAHALAARGGVQEIMLGYSDSNKENGFLAANWSLYRTQRRLARICADNDVTLRLFHGRGGSISRGGGPMNEALLALPNDTVTGPVKFTEQGEAIAEKYANPHVARRNVEQMLNAQIRARRRAIDGSGEPPPEMWLDAMERMADAARTAYRDLLESDGFVRYFEQATPITVIEALDLGSRPASRSDERTVEDLRAIPWVFSWTQSRCILPGWYGLASGIDAYLEAGGDVETLRTMYDEWPFFRTTLDNAAQSLARTDLEIAAEYAELADDRLRESFFPRCRASHDRAVELLATIRRRESLIGRPWLESSLARRNPYVDPLNLLQTSLLATDDRSLLEERTLRLTVMGIAAGMKNTG
ncbi:phosphoenolpyruvate carboxylase [Halovivax gelatinilyticus]|uniref:phosphoenolpyruvate carboxylase n=1 Tax=Halovivax gelatinilyticus TaxID=2961597 RepID=UPI0020CA448F|nr:phosphoenolpyruvate carboxylase [Halovivax gelatinilyticus]